MPVTKLLGGISTRQQFYCTHEKVNIHVNCSRTSKKFRKLKVCCMISLGKDAKVHASAVWLCIVLNDVLLTSYFEVGKKQSDRALNC